MSLISVIVVIAVVGLLTWLIVTYIPMPAPFPKVIVAVAIICVVLWLLGVFGVLDMANIRVGRVH